MYKVQKKDGQVQDFDRTKIVSGVVKAGATPEEAERVAVEVENWLPTVATEGTVNVTDIRTKVLEVLGMVNPVALGVFGAYQKPVPVESIAEVPQTPTVEPQTENVVPEVPGTEETPGSESGTDPVTQ